MSPSTKTTYNLIKNEDQSFVTVFVPGLPLRSAGDDHPSFDAAIEKLLASDKADRAGDTELAAALGQEAYDLLDVEAAVSRRFEALSDRVSVKSGQVYLDGDAVEGPIVDHIVRALEAGEDFKSLVNFYERLLANPLGHAREALYSWVDTYGLTITPEGKLIGYKTFDSVTDKDTGEVTGYQPSRISNNPDRVNGVEVEVGQYMLVNPGDVVETPRSLVLHAPSAACAEGLHIGNWSYSFSGDSKFAVLFDPRDVVNVPNSGGKLRVCRYEVLHIVTEPYTEPVLHDGEEPETWMDGEKPTLAEIQALATEAAIDAANDARDALGRWVAGRKSQRDPQTGRFSG